MFDIQLEFCTFSDFLREPFMLIFVNTLDFISDSKKTKKKEKKSLSLLFVQNLQPETDRPCDHLLGFNREK